jgi:hypothetical protein
MNKLIEAIDAARPVRTETRYSLGYADGLTKAKTIVMDAGVVSLETHKAVTKQRDMALAYIDDHGIQFGGNAPDVVRVVRCCKCKSYDHASGYCRFWHGVRLPGHYCGEGEKKDG